MNNLKVIQCFFYSLIMTYFFEVAKSICKGLFWGHVCQGGFRNRLKSCVKLFDKHPAQRTCPASYGAVTLVSTVQFALSRKEKMAAGHTHSRAAGFPPFLPRDTFHTRYAMLTGLPRFLVPILRGLRQEDHLLPGSSGLAWRIQQEGGKERGREGGRWEGGKLGTELTGKEACA